VKLLFAYSANFKKDQNGNYYTGGSIKEEMWQRYVYMSDELTIISHLDQNIYEEEFARKKFNSFDSTNKKFVPIPKLCRNLKTFINTKKYKEFREVIKNQVIANDFVIARVPSDVGIVAIKYAERFKKPYLVEVVGCPWDAYWNHSFRGKLVAPFMYYVTKNRVKNAPYVVYVTNQFLQSRYPTTGKSISCSDVTLTEFVDEVIDHRIKKIKSMRTGDKIVLGTIAAVNVRYKGQQFIIKALGRLKKQDITHYEYQLVGDGDSTYLRAIAERYSVSDQIKFLGPIPHEKIFDWLDTIDIYVQPSRLEGLPRALIEAMSRALPAFGAKTGGIPELLDQRFIFRNSRKSIKEIINILMLFDTETMREQAERNYKEAKKYDKAIIENRRINFFNDFKNNI